METAGISPGTPGVLPCKSGWTAGTSDSQLDNSAHTTINTNRLGAFFHPLLPLIRF